MSKLSKIFKMSSNNTTHKDKLDQAPQNPKPKQQSESKLTALCERAQKKAATKKCKPVKEKKSTGYQRINDTLI
jgi:hypothetical protein